MPISWSVSGSFKNTEAFLAAMLKDNIPPELEVIAREGVAALTAATPLMSGETAYSWDYEIVKKRGSWSIFWTNSNIDDNVKIAVILQYGHATGTGGYVQGQDYINPALRPIFDKLADRAWKVVTSA